jgi:hypothetical protein
MSREIYISSNIKHRGVIMSKKLFALLLLATIGSSVYAVGGESDSEVSASSEEGTAAPAQSKSGFNFSSLRTISQLKAHPFLLSFAGLVAVAGIFKASHSVVRKIRTRRNANKVSSQRK